MATLGKNDCGETDELELRVPVTFRNSIVAVVGTNRNFENGGMRPRDRGDVRHLPVCFRSVGSRTCVCISDFTTRVLAVLLFVLLANHVGALPQAL
jgi:hypothetical protein